jgi:23S rRNA (cytosine1962-C5)-methyltransferase
MNGSGGRGALGERIGAALARRAALLREPDRADGRGALRWVNGVGDSLPGLHVDALGRQLVVHVDVAECAAPPAEVVAGLLAAAAGAGQPAPRAIWWKPLRRDVRTAGKAELLPELLHGEATDGEGDGAGPEFAIREGPWRFLVRPREGYSHGLFLDQRDNRRRLREWLERRAREHAQSGRAPPVLLNTFAYTGSFSIAAATAGAAACTVDLSARYLDWARRNFVENDLEPAAHEFGRADARDWLEIAARRGRRFDAIVLDPPTFATSKQRGTFQVERDYAALAALALRVAAPGALLLCSHNQRTFGSAALREKLLAAEAATGRRIERLEPFTPPHDFPGPLSSNPAARGCWITLDRKA